MGPFAFRVALNYIVTRMSARNVLKNSLLLALFVISCDEPKFPKPRQASLEVDVLYCDTAGANLRSLGCGEGKPTRKGVSFEDLCRDLEGKNIYVGAQCLSKVKSCGQVDDCTGSR